MSFIATIIRKLNPSIVASKCRILSTTSKHFSSSTGYSTEEIEKFRKLFRTVPSYEESISSKDLTSYLQTIKLILSPEGYQSHVDYVDKVLGGRITSTQIMKYIAAQHDPRLLMTEYLLTFDRDNDGYISKEEFEFGITDVRAHDPRIKHISYENFMKEADANGDGRVSVSECKDWLMKNLIPA